MASGLAEDVTLTKVVYKYYCEHVRHIDVAQLEIPSPEITAGKTAADHKAELKALRESSKHAFGCAVRILTDSYSCHRL